MEIDAIALVTSITALVGMVGSKIVSARKASNERLQLDLDRELREQARADERERREQSRADELERREQARAEKIDSALQKAHDGAVAAVIAAATQTHDVFSKTLERVNELLSAERSAHRSCRDEVAQLRSYVGKLEVRLARVETSGDARLRAITPPDFPSARADTLPPGPKKIIPK